jgi:hypothetical protein
MTLALPSNMDEESGGGVLTVGQSGMVSLILALVELAFGALALGERLWPKRAPKGSLWDISATLLLVSSEKGPITKPRCQSPQRTCSAACINFS